MKSLLNKFKRIFSLVRFFFRWLRLERLFIRQLRILVDHKGIFVTAHGRHALPKIALLVRPWYRNTVPFFSIFMGRMIANTGRARVTFLLDDSLFGLEPRWHRFQVNSIERVLAKYFDDIPVIRLSSLEPIVLDEIDVSAVSELARLNCVHFFRSETLAKSRDDVRQLFNKQLLEASTRIKAASEKSSFERLIVPGGVCSTSGLFLKFFGSASTVSSFDSGEGILQYCVQGIASHLADIPSAHEILRGDERFETLSKEGYDAEVALRVAGKDAFASQVTASTCSQSAAEKGTVLFALNISWDTAALGLSKLFPGAFEWLEHGIEWYLKNSTLDIVIRQHPAERFENLRSFDDFSGFMQKWINEPRVIFHDCNANISTYDLLSRADFVHVHTSTFGLEACSYGKCVITCSASYFSRVDAVFYASDLGNYEFLMAAASLGSLSVSDEMKKRAKELFFLSQVCNWQIGKTDPCANFEQLVTRSPAELESDPILRRTLESMLEGTPIAVLAYIEKNGGFVRKS